MKRISKMYGKWNCWVCVCHHVPVSVLNQLMSHMALPLLHLMLWRPEVVYISPVPSETFAGESPWLRLYACSFSKKTFI